MSAAMTRAEGLEFVRAAVADCLARGLEEVKPASRLITDLGADSLDFIDLIFTVEKQFGVKIREDELNFLSRFESSEGGESHLPKEAVERLRRWFPALEQLGDLTRVKPAQLIPLITVEAIWALVEHKLLEQQRS